MPVIFSFELKEARPEQAQIGALFERFGWERLSEETYRFPRLAPEPDSPPLEDWLNHVVPALMLFRCYVLSHRLTVNAMTLDARSSTGYRREAQLGNPPLHADNVRLYDPKSYPRRRDAPPRDNEHDEQEWSTLADWLDAVSFPLGL